MTQVHRVSMICLSTKVEPRLPSSSKFILPCRETSSFPKNCWVAACAITLYNSSQSCCKTHLTCPAQFRGPSSRQEGSSQHAATAKVNQGCHKKASRQRWQRETRQQSPKASPGKPTSQPGQRLNAVPPQLTVGDSCACYVGGCAAQQQPTFTFDCLQVAGSLIPPPPPPPPIAAWQ